MNAAAMEVFLARLYTDDALRRAFLAAPADVARGAGLEEDAVQALVLIDRDGLRLAAASYAGKRSVHAGERRGKGHRAGLLQRLQALLVR
jgi:hypothetical protein